MRNKQIEGLRAMGVMMIVLFHYIYRFNELYGDASAFSVLSQWGTIGVGLFFMISGYFMFGGSHKANETLLQYYKRKVGRLYTPYLPAIIVIFLVTSVAKLPGRTTAVFDALLNVVLINGFIGTPYVDTAHWYLTYLIAFIVIAGIVKYSKIKETYAIPVWILFSYIIRVPIGRLGMPSAVEHFLHVISGGGNLYPFILGVVICELKAKKEKSLLEKGVLLLSATFSIYNIMVLYNKVAAWWIIVFALVFILCIDGKLNFFSCDFLQKIAGISYPLYLIHQNIGYVIILSLRKVVGYEISVIVAIFVAAFLAVVLCQIEKLTKGRAILCQLIRK